MKRKHIGWIALDIDGTITDKSHHAPKPVVDFLHTLVDKGWEIIFITGRTFSFASQALDAFDFPFYLAVQNGADILYMPSMENVSRHYLNEKVIPILEEAYRDESEDFVLYAGYENGDFCYYRPGKFSPAFAEHLEKIKPLSPEAWKPVGQYAFQEGLQFPLAKCFGHRDAIERICQRLHAHPDISATMIRDPLGEDIYIILVTAKEATKGNALYMIRDILGDGGPVIAAGDDLNDISMLQAADIKIVMPHAPPEMHAMATILAKEGIIAALTQATQQSTWD